MLKRLLYFIPTLIGVNLIVFLMFFVVNTPDHMAQQALGDKASNREAILRWKQARGYDLPYLLNVAAPGSQKLTQTIFFQKNLKMLWGDFGVSDMTLQPIASDIWHRLPPTLCLTVPVFFASLLINITLAMLSASQRGHWFDRGMQVTCVLTMSISSLVYIIAGQFWFAKVLRWVPVSGFLPGTDMIRFLVLPVIIGILGNLGGEIRFYRTLFLEEINKDYVRTAKAKGLSQGRILFLHVLKNAMISILTNVPVQMLMLIMGSFLLENFFSIPGMGSYTIRAINSQDFAVVRVMVFLGSALYMLGLLLTDICYSLVDPRVRIK